MKKISLIKAVSLFMIILLVSASLFQCKKEGDIISGLDRSFKGNSDSTIYASFYDTTKIATADATADVNDVIRFRGVQTLFQCKKEGDIISGLDRSCKRIS